MKNETIDFLEQLNSPITFHGIKSFDLAFEKLICSFNDMLSNLMQDKEKRHMICEYANFAKKLYKTQDLLKSNKNEYLDTDMLLVVDYVKTLVKKSNMQNDLKKNQNGVRINNNIRAGMLRKTASLKKEMDFLHKELKENRYMDMHPENENHILFLNKYKSCLKRIIFNKAFLGLYTKNIECIINDECVWLSNEQMFPNVKKDFKEYEACLLKNKITLRHNADDEFIQRINLIKNNTLEIKILDDFINKHKEQVFNLFSFESNSIYSF